MQGNMDQSISFVWYNTAAELKRRRCIYFLVLSYVMSLVCIGSRVSSFISTYVWSKVFCWGVG